MAFIRSTADVGFDFISEEFGTGFLSFDFDPSATSVISNLTPTGFDIQYGGIATGRYEGSGLTYAPVTQGGVTLQSPDGGVINRYVEIYPSGSYRKRFVVDGADFFDAGATPSDADNLALFQESLEGDDTILMEGEGEDRIHGFQGDDVIRGGALDDVLNGRAGDDTLRGDGGDDVIRGSGGDDRLQGGKGNDSLHGDKGDDRLAGNAGEDEFVYDPGDAGADRIVGFEEGVDAVVLRSFATVNSLSDMTTSTFAGSAIVEFDGIRIMFVGASLADLSNAWFDFT